MNLFKVLDSLINKAKHKETFKPCLDPLMELSSSNQVKPSMFNQHKSFSSNKTQFAVYEANKIQFGIGEPSKLQVIENSQAHMDSVCTQIISIASRESGTLPKY